MRPISYDRIYYADVRAADPPAVIRAAAENQAPHVHPDRMWIGYVTDRGTVTAAQLGNPAWRITIHPAPLAVERPPADPPAADPPARAESYPSIRSLCQIKDVTPADARAIRAIMAGPKRENGETRMERIDRVLRTCGVERIAAGHNRRSPAIVYCNTGDTYATTVLKIRGRFRVGCWGDIVERGSYD